MRKLTWACVGCCFHTRSFQQARGQARGGESSREGFLQRDFPIVSQRATASAVCTGNRSRRTIPQLGRWRNPSKQPRGRLQSACEVPSSVIVLFCFFCLVFCFVFFVGGSSLHGDSLPLSSPLPRADAPRCHAHLEPAQPPGSTDPRPALRPPSSSAIKHPALEHFLPGQAQPPLPGLGSPAVGFPAFGTPVPQTPVNPQQLTHWNLTPPLHNIQPPLQTQFQLLQNQFPQLGPQPTQQQFYPSAPLEMITNPAPSAWNGLAHLPLPPPQPTPQQNPNQLQYQLQYQLQTPSYPPSQTLPSLSQNHAHPHDNTNAAIALAAAFLARGGHF